MALLAPLSLKGISMTTKRRARVGRIQTVGGVSAEMGRIYRLARWGEIKPDEAKTLVTILAYIEAARRIFPGVSFNEETTEAGREALGYYHERKDERRDIGLGPEHDWSSHAADAFGLMAVCCEDPSVTRAFNRKIEYPKIGVV
jgi:hypothetical protein